VKVVVCGYMIRYPLAGMMLAYFNYVAGLYRLGHEVVYLEESGWPGSCYDPHRQTHGDDPRIGIESVRSLFREHGLDIPVCYVRRDTGETFGTDRTTLQTLLDQADLLLNLGGVCWLPEFERCRRRALVDMDPFFTQIGQFGLEGIERYQARFSYGHNIGRPDCGIPADGYDWLATVPPVVTEAWQEAAARPAPAHAPFTTIASWTAYGAVTHEGEEYGQKDREFLALLELPRRIPQSLEIALSGADDAARRTLIEAGWSVRDAGEVTANPAAYQDYIADSRGEFSVAKHAYVKTRSGWFSDRSVCYLAAGRPVVLQDTGIGEWLPVGSGVLCFRSPDEAAACLEAVDAAYPHHCRAARALAERYFDYRVALPALLERAMG
jgi:hypothetical protein